MNGFLRKLKLKITNPTVKCSKTASLNQVELGGYTQITSQVSIQNSKIDDYTSIGRNSTINNAEIGKFCSISWNTTIGATSHPENHISTHAFAYVTQFGFVSKNNKIRVKTIIGNDVWIGANAVILPGIEIGTGAIIGAGAIVTKSVAPYSIVVGSPAKHLRFRFNDHKIQSLLNSEWWNWPHSKIKSHIHLFQKPFDPNGFDSL